MSKKINISVLQEYAISKGGLLLSSVYADNNTKLLWQCKEKHQWPANWGSVKNLHSWCPHCAGLFKPDIKILQDHAISKGGRLVSIEYENNSSLLEWECKETHQWSARWNNIKNGNTWCKQCIGLSKPNIDELQRYALSKDGLLISTEYINAYTKMLWQCRENHQWTVNWNDVKNNNHWCPHCAGNAKITSEYILIYLNKHHPGCIWHNPDKYKNNRTKLHITCNHGHDITPTWSDIQSKKSWCRACVKFNSVHETMCYDIINKLLPGFEREYVINCDNHKYRLDGYNKDFKIAFEYNGEQHYNETHYNHHAKNGSMQEFIDLQYRDSEKVKYCIKNDITLITIPYWIEDNKLERYILDAYNTG